MKLLLRGTSAVLLAICLLAACGDSEDHGTGAESCQAIVDACHDVDPGTGPITDCHDTAHDVGTAAACDPIQANCVALCRAAADAGM